MSLGRTTAACHGASGGATRRHERRRHDAPPNDGPYGQARSSRRRTKATSLDGPPGASSWPSSNQRRVSAAYYQRLPLAVGAPAGRPACRSESRVDHKPPGRKDAACDPLDSHPCYRAKRGAASGQESIEVTHQVFSWLFVFFVFLRETSCRRVVTASVPRASAAFVDKRLSAEVARPGGRDP